MPKPPVRARLPRAAAALAALALTMTAAPRAADPDGRFGRRLSTQQADTATLHPSATASRNAKQALLAGASRAARDVEVLATRPTSGRFRGGAPRSLYVPGHIVVKFAPEVTESAMGAMAQAAGGTRVLVPHDADFAYVEIPADADPVAAAAKLSGRAGVVYAEPDARAFPLYTPNDPLWKYQWNLDRLDFPRTWDINKGGKSSVTVAVVDTGVAYVDQGDFSKAPDLAGTTFVPGYDFIWDDDQPVDMDGHGTHVTGTVAETTNNDVGVAGIAFNVSVMPVKALLTDWDEALGAPYPYGASTVARGIRFAADHGAKVINLSLGSFAPNTATHDAVVYAVDKGVFVAAAAGNNGDTDNAPLYPAVYAKDIDGFVAVSGVDYAFHRAPYSNTGDYVEIAAPGGDIDADLNNDGYGDGVLQQTLDPDAVASGVFNRFLYLFADGTSMATPHVAAFAALLIDQGITNPAAVEAALKHFATDLGPAGRDDEFGYGLLNPRDTLRGLGLRR